MTVRAAEALALQHARQVAEETALAQRAFLTNMNHELRTPLNGVMGMLQVLLETELDGDQRSYANVAFRSSEELLALVSQVMDFSAIEMGQHRLHPTAVISEARSGGDPPGDQCGEIHRHEGAGLGLTIAHRIVRRMGGDLEVVSEVGRGSAFWFSVPLQLP